jgi:hypothetical protein
VNSVCVRARACVFVKDGSNIHNIVAWRLKAEIAEPERKPTARQTHVPEATTSRAEVHCWPTAPQTQVPAATKKSIPSQRFGKRICVTTDTYIMVLSFESTACRKTVVVQGSRCRKENRELIQEFFVIRHRRKDNSSPVRNWANRRQSLIVSCYNWLWL